MREMKETLLKKNISEQAAAYLFTGIFISISHHFHNYTVVIFIGHLLIAASFLKLISIMLNHNWMRRISSPLNIFDGTVFILAFAAGFAIFIVEEFVYYKESNLLSQNLYDSLFITIVIAGALWILLLCIPL